MSSYPSNAPGNINDTFQECSSFDEFVFLYVEDMVMSKQMTTQVLSNWSKCDPKKGG